MSRHRGLGAFVLRCAALVALAVPSGCQGAAEPGADAADRGGDSAAVSELSVAEVEALLVTAGFQPERGEAVHQSFLAVEGIVVRVPGAELQVYLYDDAAARARDTSRLDRARVAPPDMMISWIMPPSLVETDNAAIIILTEDEALRSRITDALR